MRRLVSTVRSCRRMDTGGLAEARVYGVVLDQTVLVPPAQGYLGDCGSLQLVDHALGPQVRVLGVQLLDGETVHIVDTLLVEGQMVHVSLDWTQRFDFLQQHTAQHLLNGVALNLFNSRTTKWSSVPGQQFAAYIDVKGAKFTDDELNRLERGCNDAINLHLPITQARVRQPGRRNGLQADDAGSSNEAEDPAPQATPWMTVIQGVGADPCDKFHLQNTKELRVLKIVGCKELFTVNGDRTGQSRLHFLAGQRYLGLLESLLNKPELRSKAFRYDTSLPTTAVEHGVALGKRSLQGGADTFIGRNTNLLHLSRVASVATQVAPASVFLLFATNAGCNKGCYDFLIASPGIREECHQQLRRILEVLGPRLEPHGDWLCGRSMELTAEKVDQAFHCIVDSLG